MRGMAMHAASILPGAALVCAALAGAAIAASPARAETVEELDALSQATASERAGLALARRQVAEGDLPGALAALERVLMQRPQSKDALLLHASLLCRLDDRPGAAVEFDYLRKGKVPAKELNEALAPCDPGWQPDAPVPVPVAAPASATAPQPAAPPAPTATPESPPAAKPARPRRRPGFGF